MAFSNTSRDLISRWFVGSSRTSKFTGCDKIQASSTRDFSPPDKTEIFFSTSSPENKKDPKRDLIKPIEALGTRPSTSCRIVFLGSNTSKEFCEKYPN